MKKSKVVMTGTCFKCDKPGHYATECLIEGVLCYGCKTPGITRPNCIYCKMQNLGSKAVNQPKRLTATQKISEISYPSSSANPSVVPINQTLVVKCDNPDCKIKQELLYAVTFELEDQVDDGNSSSSDSEIFQSREDSDDEQRIEE